ncbi:MAG: hypothetical protein JWQ11_4742 [Rhizobacter sp.]|nr:hypothetical protein [Rhizobacter sp.]
MGIEALNPINIIAGIFDAIFHKQTPEEKISKMLEDYKKNPNGADGDKLLDEIKKDIGFDPETGELDESKLENHPQLAEMADAIKQMEGNGFNSFNILDSLTGSADAPEPGKKMGL